MNRPELVTKRITTEEMVRSQLALITSIRSDVGRRDRVQAWSEALEALADLVAPWAAQDERFAKEWEDRPLAILDMGDGSSMPFPTATDCREAQRILTAMMDRQGLMAKRRTVSGPGARVFPAPQDGQTEPAAVEVP